MGNVRDHLTTTVDKRLKQLIRHSAPFEAEDPVEAIHDLRVASRRLRAFLAVFEPRLGGSTRKRARKPLKRLTGAIRALRDLDVHAALLRAHRDAVDDASARAAVEHLISNVAIRRDEEASRVAHALSDFDFDRIVA